MLTIIENEKEYNFKASAVTRILYKRVFGTEPDKFFTDRAQLLQDEQTREDFNKLRIAQTLSDDDPKKKELLAEIVTNDNILRINSDFSDFARQYGYITFIEANNEPAQVFKLLSFENYLTWLMQFEESFFTAHAPEFQTLYDINKKAGSSAKNA